MVGWVRVIERIVHGLHAVANAMEDPEKWWVALRAAFFIMDAPAPSPEDRNFRQLVFKGDQGEVTGSKSGSLARLPSHPSTISKPLCRCERPAFKSPR